MLSRWWTFLRMDSPILCLIEIEHFIDSRKLDMGISVRLYCGCYWTKKLVSGKYGFPFEVLVIMKKNLFLFIRKLISGEISRIETSFHELLISNFQKSVMS